MKNEYEEKMLLLLVEKYRRSKKDSGTEQIHRRTKIKPTELYKNYDANTADIDKINALNEMAAYYQKLDFLTFKPKKYSNEISEIYLNDDKIEEAEQYLVNHFQYESKHSKMHRVSEIIRQYRDTTPIAAAECEKLQKSVDKNVVPKNYEKTADVLKALVFIEQNSEMLYLREASMLIYGSSKYLEENTLESICSLIRKYKKRPCREDEQNDEILRDYAIQVEKQKICIKGNVSMQIAGKWLDISCLKSGMEFYTDEIADIERIKIHDSRLITVENKTSYLRSQEADTAYFYLGGYANRFQRDFLKKIYEDNPAIRYLHFGDIDAGGFLIHANLCQITGIPFSIYHMSVRELENPIYISCHLPLTSNDRKRLRALKDQVLYHNVVSYMLEHNVKMEQEIVSY